MRATCPPFSQTPRRLSLRGAAHRLRLRQCLRTALILYRRIFARFGFPDLLQGRGCIVLDNADARKVSLAFGGRYAGEKRTQSLYAVAAAPGSRLGREFIDRQDAAVRIESC